MNSRLKHLTLLVGITLAFATCIHAQTNKLPGWATLDSTNSKVVVDTMVAASSGDHGAQLFLAQRYERGIGVKKDFRSAFRWYERSAKQGTALAMLNLGNFYAKGMVVAADYAEAYKWYNLASTSDRIQGVLAATARDSLAKKMTAEQIAEGQRRAEEFKPQEEVVVSVPLRTNSVPEHKGMKANNRA